MKKDTKIINMMGSACSGKTTIASGLFHLMKLNKYSVELVQEYAKELVYENPAALKDQFFVTAMQTKRINRLLGKVDYIVTDSPILLGEIYKDKKSFLKESFYLDLFSQYENMNYFLNRQFPFVQEGRVHTEQDSVEISKRLKQLLTKNGISFVDLESDFNTHNVIFNLIDKRHKQNI